MIRQLCLSRTDMIIIGALVIFSDVDIHRYRFNFFKEVYLSHKLI